MKAATVMYTHTDAKDCWTPFFGQLGKYQDEGRDLYVLVNTNDPDLPKGCKVITYDEKLPYSDRLASCLEQMPSPYILFQHEDMFLYYSPDWGKVDLYTDRLRGVKRSFVKLIRGGVWEGSPDTVYPELRSVDGEADYIFAIQPTIWKTADLLKVCRSTRGGSIWEFESKATESCRRYSILGYYVDDGGDQRGSMHWDSLVYPYVATAVVKGKWNLAEYPKELGHILDSYGIDPAKRGSR